MPKVNKIPVTGYELKQPKSEVMSSTPLRGLLVNPSDGGKTTLMANMVLSPDMYRGVWDRIFIASPTIHLDATWDPVKKYIYEELGHDDEKEGPACMDTYDVPALKKIIATQKAIRQHLMEKYAKPHWRGPKKMPQVLIILDDWADRPDVLQKRGGEDVLATLFVKGRHYFISTLCSVQKLKAVNSVVRTQATALFVGRLKNATELMDGIVREFSAIQSAATILAMYHRAVSYAPYSFFYIDLSKPSGPKFFINFEVELRRSEDEET
jgi:hypothetical protein